MNPHLSNTKTYYYIYTKILGFLEIILDEENKVKNVIFVDSKKENYTQVPKSIKEVLDDYFLKGKDLPSNIISEKIRGTIFQKNVWNIISRVPFGKTITYTEIAIKLGKPSSARTIGNACGKNPVALFIPCHRVIRKQSEDYGYSWGKERKKYLLYFENNNIIL